MSDRPSLLPRGAVIGERYRVERLLGEGGMGAVYEAENTLTGRPVAIKVLNTRTTPEVRRRLLREARVAARVQHPNVIDIYDVGFEGEEMFLVMELLRGEALDAWLERRAPVEPDAILGLVQQLLRGLGALHAAGVIHRDLKPANVFVVESEHEAPRAKLLDLGIARDRGTDSETFTQPDQILGTPAYMAPEQLERPDSIDRRADIHAVGVILYEALAGHRPYRAPDLTALAVAILAGQRAPLHEVRPDLPEGLCAEIERALSRSPRERHADAAALGQALAPYGPEGAFVPPPAPPPRRFGWMVAAVVLGAFGLVAVTTLALRPRPDDPARDLEGPSAPPPPSEPSALPALPDAAMPRAAISHAAIPDAGAPLERGDPLPLGADPPDPPDEPVRRGAGRRPPVTPPEPEPPARPTAPHLGLDPDDF